MALRNAREMGKLCTELAVTIPGAIVCDAFRAELLLGYVAGIPKAEVEGFDDEAQTKTNNGKEG